MDARNEMLRLLRSRKDGEAVDRIWIEREHA